ncbi:MULTISPECIES: MFS transporter [Burkholderia]|uniref:MFS transporter n=1 Tax=Burkholderia TaxID=32008 RepID=UPI0009F5DCC2|nr:MULTISPECIES: MFS transporter [unclassified Burkholderia]
MGKNPGRTFGLLWLAHGTSAVGSQISQVVIPLFAVQNLHFSAIQLGFLLSLEGLPTVLFGLFAGVLVDRMPRRRLLIVCDIARFAILLLVPLLYWLDLLHAFSLYAVAFTVSSLSVFFDTAFWSYVPTVIEKSELSQGNSRLAMTQSVAETIGPSVAGSIMSLIGAPGAILLDALSYLWSFLLICFVRHEPEKNTAAAVGERFFPALKKGLVFVLTNRLLVLIALGGVIWHIAYFALLPGLYLWLQKTVGASATQIGIVLSCLGIGAAVSAPLTPMLRRRMGPLPVLASMQLVSVISILAIPLAKSSALVDLAIAGGALAVMGGTSTIASIMQMTLRQEVTPEPLLGRMTSAIRLIVWGAMPVGALIGGALFGVMPNDKAFYVIGAVSVAATLLWGAALFWRPIDLAYSAD